MATMAITELALNVHRVSNSRFTILKGAIFEVLSLIKVSKDNELRQLEAVSYIEEANERIKKEIKTADLKYTIATIGNAIIAALAFFFML